MTTENFTRYVTEFGDSNLAREVDDEAAKEVTQLISGSLVYRLYEALDKMDFDLASNSHTHERSDLWKPLPMFRRAITFCQLSGSATRPTRRRSATMVCGTRRTCGNTARRYIRNFSYRKSCTHCVAVIALDLHDDEGSLAYISPPESEKFTPLSALRREKPADSFSLLSLA